jgi:S-adenosylmethionine decarboxylase
LGESHISIHTWPEAGYAAVDVFTCGRHTRPEAACEYLIDVFQARRYSLRKVPRRTAQPTLLEEAPDSAEVLTCEATRRRR